MDNSIVVSTPPHVKTKRTTRDIMLDVVIAMLPCAIAGVVFFGWQALCIILMSVFACIATEFVYFFIANKGFSQKCKKAGEVCRRWARQFDLTSVVTGLILALILPVTDKWYEVFYEVIIGGIIAIAVVKMMFGGTGKNLVNPAALARVFMFLSFTLTVYTACKVDAILPSTIPLKDGTVVTGATNINGILTLSKGKDPASYLSNLDLFLGTGVPGCIGETSKAAILLGYIYLVVRKVLKWWQPLLFLGVFGVCAVLGVTELVKDNSLAQAMAKLGVTNFTMNFGWAIMYSLFAGIGFTLVMVIMSGLREKLNCYKTPKALSGFPLAMVTASFICMAFMVFSYISI